MSKLIKGLLTATLALGMFGGITIINQPINARRITSNRVPRKHYYWHKGIPRIIMGT